jgi:hypothetical protein
LSGFTKQAFL